MRFEDFFEIENIFSDFANILADFYVYVFITVVKAQTVIVAELV